MASQNSYLAYKRDTRHLLYWMIHASNAIIKASPATEDGAAMVVNNTGQTTTPEVLTMSELIAKHVQSVPSIVYRLLQSVIKARSTTYAAFQPFAMASPAEQVDKNNASHKHFIDTLTRAFSILGGEAWESAQNAGKGKVDDGGADEEVTFSNKFSLLNLGSPSKDGADATDESENESADDAQQASAASRRRQQKKVSSTKKNKKGEKHALERVDWSPSGPWHVHRRLYGLDEFAGAVTSPRHAAPQRRRAQEDRAAPRLPAAVHRRRHDRQSRLVAQRLQGQRREGAGRRFSIQAPRRPLARPQHREARVRIPRRIRLLDGDAGKGRGAPRRPEAARAPARTAR